MYRERAVRWLAIAAAIFAVWARADVAERVVHVDSGDLAGVVQGDVISFKGIPYAAPPVGDLRWRAPQPVAAWSGVRKADKVGALCMQKINPADNGVGPPPNSEDCLTLNVFAPAHVNGSAGKSRLPVMYWIHGGGFVNGSGTAALYDGSELAKLGVVVVTINYRLGRFGFFAHPALTRENPAGPQANFALMDMIAGLQWVKRNIAAFGGDAGNVTIFGESAGGAAVNQLMISPPARGLFHKAIAQSGLGRERRAYLDRASPDGQPSAHDDGVAFATKLGVKADDLVALRAVPADTIVANTDPNVGPSPVIEGNLVPEDVGAAFEAGRQAKVPYMAGSNALEFPFYSDSLPGTIGRMMKFSPEERTRIVAAYGGEDNFKTNIISDVLFTEAARYMTRVHAKSGQAVYLYRFSVLPESAPPQIKGTPHAQERQYVFNTLSTSPWKTGSRDEQAAKLVTAYWVAFAKTGNPNGAGRPEWPSGGATDGRIFELTNDGPALSPTPDAAALDALAARY